MKQREAENRLCMTCRRSCKQPGTVVIARCPRYYAGPKIKHNTWKQLELAF